MEPQVKEHWSHWIFFSCTLDICLLKWCWLTDCIHTSYTQFLHLVFKKKISLELSGNKTSSSISIFDTVKQPPPNIFSMSKHSWNMDIFHMYCKILFRFRFIVTHLIACPPSWVILMCFCKAVSVQTEKSHSSQKWTLSVRFFFFAITFFDYCGKTIISRLKLMFL